MQVRITCRTLLSFNTHVLPKGSKQLEDRGVRLIYNTVALTPSTFTLTAALYVSCIQSDRNMFSHCSRFYMRGSCLRRASLTLAVFLSVRPAPFVRPHLITETKLRVSEGSHAVGHSSSSPRQEMTQTHTHTSRDLSLLHTHTQSFHHIPHPLCVCVCVCTLVE